jgi:hypothetical protein
MPLHQTPLHRVNRRWLDQISGGALTVVISLTGFSVLFLARLLNLYPPTEVGHVNSPCATA